MPELNVPGNGYLKLDYWEWKDFFAQVGCPRICSRSTVSETCGLTLKTERESAENRTEVPHPSVQTTDGRMGHRPATLPRRRFMPSPPAKGPATRLAAAAIAAITLARPLRASRSDSLQLTIKVVTGSC